MKKLGYVSIGIIVGLLMSLAVGVYGEELSLVGNKVGSEWTLTIDGEEVGVVPIIKGRSYAPVRLIAESAGFDVEFEEGEVYLITKPEIESTEQVKEPEKEPVNVPTPVKEAIDLEKELYMIDSKIVSLKMEQHGEKVAADPSSNLPQERVNYATNRLAEIQAELVELESQKAELESKIKAAE